MAVDLREYYGNVKDLGVFATVHNQVQVDVTVYSMLRIRDEKTIAFTMPNRLTHHNLQSCNHAAYLIKEQGPGHTHPYYPPPPSCLLNPRPRKGAPSSPHLRTPRGSLK